MEVFERIKAGIGIVRMYLTVKMPKDDFLQECSLIVLQAIQEHDPARGSFNTVLKKIAQRRNIQLRRETVKQKRRKYAEAKYHHDKYKDAGYRVADCPALHRNIHAVEEPELPDDDTILNVQLVTDVLRDNSIQWGRKK